MGNLFCSHTPERPHQIIITLGGEMEPLNRSCQTNSPVKLDTIHPPSPVNAICARKTYQNESQTKIYDSDKEFLNITVQNNHPLLKNEN